MKYACINFPSTNMSIVKFWELKLCLIPHFGVEFLCIENKK